MLIHLIYLRIVLDPQRKPVPVPVHITKYDSPSNLIDFEQKTDRIRPCIVCKRYFNDLSSTGLCSECDYKKNPSLPRQIIIRRSPPTNTTYTTIYPNSDFMTPLSFSSRTKGPLKIICPRCKSLNVVNNIQHSTDYTCSICRALLHIPRY